MTYDDFLRSLSIKDILVDAGYTLNKRDGLRYPSYVRYGSDGTRIRGDKFIVTQNGNCCLQNRSYTMSSHSSRHFPKSLLSLEVACHLTIWLTLFAIV